MDIARYKTKAKCLLITWLVSVLVLAIGSNVYMIHMLNTTGKSPIYMLSGYQIFSLMIVAVYFIPMLLAIHHYAKLAQMKKTRVAARVLLSFYTIGAVLEFAMTILEIVRPGTFR